MADDVLRLEQTLEQSLEIGIEWNRRLELRRDQIAADIATRSAEIEGLAFAAAGGDELARVRAGRCRAAINKLELDAANVASGLTLSNDFTNRLRRTIGLLDGELLDG